MNLLIRIWQTVAGDWREAIKEKLIVFGDIDAVDVRTAILEHFRVNLKVR